VKGDNTCHHSEVLFEEWNGFSFW